MKTLIRQATILFTVVVALTALLATAEPSVPSVATRHMLATSPRVLLDATSSTRRMLAIDSTTDLGQQLTSRRRVL